MGDNKDTFKVITANRLKDGAIVYLKSFGNDLEWTEKLDEAYVFTGDEVDEALKAAEDSDTIVVSPYDMEVAGRKAPLSAREKIRSRGPSIKFGNDARQPDFDI